MPPMSTSTKPATNPPNQTQKVKCVVLGAADAGKTSILRRFCRDTFCAHSRVPNVGSDYYTKRLTLQNDQPVLLQLFDTPGGVRAAQEDQDAFMESVLAAFVGRVDGVLLVYDMTNSTSFTQLRLWHAQWRKHASNTPILIVGNKRDLISTTTSGHPLPTVPQRHVLGCAEEFKGKDFRYEYRVDHQVLAHNVHHNHNHHKSSPPPARRHLQMLPSTFTSTATNVQWTELDGTYLDSLLGTEDRSNPDRDMVKLWCLRQGLQHVEVSALMELGGDVSVAMEALVELVLQSRQSKEEPQITTTTDAETIIEETPPPPPPPTEQSPLVLPTNNHTNGFHHPLHRPNRKLDLLERYKPKDPYCCFGFCPQPSVFQWLQWLPRNNGPQHRNRNGHHRNGENAVRQPEK